jgi:acyl dehydratase
MTDDAPTVLSSDLVGAAFELPPREIGWRETSNYAAAVGDLNPRYFDDTGGKTLIAPPMFAVAVTWQLFVTQWRGPSGVLVPDEIAVQGVHATQHMIFHRPIVAGDVLRVDGRVLSMIPTPAGAYVVTQLDIVDRDGDVVVSEYNGSMYRGIECPDGGRTASSPPAVPEFVAPDTPIREQPIPIDRGLPHVYDGCADIFSPIHTSPAVARERAGLPDIILQGTCSLALAAREIVDGEAAGDPTRLEALACRFSSFIIPGTTARLEILGTVRNGPSVDVFFQVLNGDGEAALSNGYARIGGDDPPSG